MRTLQVLPSLNALDGGAPTVALHANIAKHRSGIDTTIVFSDTGHSEDAQARLASAGIPTLAFPVVAPNARLTKRWGVSPGLAWWLVRNVRRYDVVHVDGVWGMPSVVAVAAARVAGRPTALTPHESLTRFDVETLSPTRARRVLKAVLKRFYMRWVDLIVFSSELERVDSADGRRGGSAVIHHPVVDEAEPFELPPAPQREGRAIGFLGRLHPKKNLELLIRALARLPEDARLVVGGTGPDAYVAELRRVAEEAGVAARVDWRGFLEPDARAAFFGEIDVLAMPSAYECYGMVAAEALAAGVPVVVSSRTGLAEIVGRHGGGVVCDPEVDEVARSLRTVLAGSEDARARAREAAVAALGYSVYGEQMRRSYASLV